MEDNGGEEIYLSGQLGDYVFFCLLGGMKPLLSLILLLTVSFVLPNAIRAQSRPAADTSYNEDYDKTFTKVEVEAAFPGGSAAWLNFLNTHLVYPKKAVSKKIEGVVVVQFIVDYEGNVTSFVALTGDPILQEAALKAMKQSPNWIPATQNGRKVRSYKKQPIVFKLQAN
jgi:TonB family protein